MHEIVKYFILTEIQKEIDRRTLDPLKLIECGAGTTAVRGAIRGGQKILYLCIFAVT